MRGIFLNHLLNKKSVVILILLMVVSMAIVVVFVEYEHFDSGSVVRVDSRWTAEIMKQLNLYEKKQESDSREQEENATTFLLSLKEKLNGFVNSASNVEEPSNLEKVHNENGDKEKNNIKEKTVTSSNVGMKHVTQHRNILTEKSTESQEVTESSRGQAGDPFKDENKSIEDIKQEILNSVTQERSK